MFVLVLFMAFYPYDSVILNIVLNIYVIEDKFLDSYGLCSIFTCLGGNIFSGFVWEGSFGV